MTESTTYDKLFVVDYRGGGQKSKFSFFQSTKGKVFLGSLVAIAVISTTTAALTMASQNQQEQQAEAANPQLSDAVAQATAKFCLDLYKDVASSVQSSDNIFLSPFSINAALGMTLAGARGNTASQMISGLHLPQDPDVVHAGFQQLLSQIKSTENYTLETANRMYVNQGFKLLESFQTLLESNYLATAENVNFADEAKARTAINDWVAEITREKIKDLIAPGILNELTRLVLVNAIYFKGKWKKPFDKEITSDRPFHTSASTSVQVAMMRREESFRLGYLEELKTRVLEIPYNDPRLGMLIFLPDEVEGIKLLEEKVQDLPLLDIDSLLRTTKVNVVLPKFKVELSVSLKEHLMNLGITDLFDDEKVDLSGITGHNDLVVSKVIHKAFIEVNEEGSEAAAATAAVVRMKRSMDMGPEPFIADHPFLFSIRDSRSGIHLFMGRLTEPLSVMKVGAHDEL